MTVGLRKNKRHTILLEYDGVGEVRRISSLIDMLSLHIQEVFIDSLMFEIIPELRTLIEHGVRVFYLLDLKLLRAFRDINYMAKNDENDARLLSVITSEKFKECSPDFLRLKELLVLHCRFRRQIRKIQQWYDVLSLNSSKDYIAECSHKMRGIEEEFAGEL